MGLTTGISRMLKE